MSSGFIVVSPHFDDGIGSCAGTLARAQARSMTATVLTVMARPPVLPFIKHLLKSGFERRAGEPWWFRAREDHRACALLGIRRAELDFVDALYRTDSAGRRLYPTAHSLNGEPQDADAGLVERIAGAVDQYSEQNGGDANLLAFPMAIGDHVDHQLTARAGLKLLEAGRAVVFFRDFFYSGPVTRVQTELAQARRLRAELSKAEIDRKIDSLCSYRSQIGPLYGSLAIMRERVTSLERTEEFLMAASLPAHARQALEAIVATSPQR